MGAQIMKNAFRTTAVLYALLCSSALANQGLDSTSDDLPISAGGTPAVLVGAGQAVPAGDVEFLNSVGVGTPTPKTALEVTGAVKVGQTAAVCSAALAGAIRWNHATTQMEVCNGAAWVALGGSAGSLCGSFYNYVGQMGTFAQCLGVSNGCPSGYSMVQTGQNFNGNGNGVTTYYYTCAKN
jgi:hypothetical protein